MDVSLMKNSVPSAQLDIPKYRISLYMKQHLMSPVLHIAHKINVLRSME